MLIHVLIAAPMCACDMSQRAHTSMTAELPSVNGRLPVSAVKLPVQQYLVGVGTQAVLIWEFHISQRFLDAFFYLIGRFSKFHFKRFGRLSCPLISDGLLF